MPQLSDYMDNNVYRSVVNVVTVDFFELLCLMFIYLKITGQIDWYWILILSPLVIAALRK